MAFCNGGINYWLSLFSSDHNMFTYAMYKKAGDSPHRNVSNFSV